MLTVDYDRWAVKRGERLLDLGCGEGRHTFEALRRGMRVVSVDLDEIALKETATTSAAMCADADGATASCVRGDALGLPFDDGRFDRVLVAETLEHIVEDERALGEIARVVRPGGAVAVTVPRYWPERICWALSSEYHSNEGGHVRIYRGSELRARLRRAGLEVVDGHHAHALHSPYWWLRCATGMSDGALIPSLYHRFLVWDLMHKPALTRRLESALDPLLGKSVVVYARKPEES